jgi:hypothetical protein
MLGKPALARLLGQSVAKGLQSHYTSRQTGCKPVVEPWSEAERKYKDGLAKLLEKGHTVYENELETASLMPQIAYNATRKVIAEDPIPTDWDIVLVEEDLGEAYGHARPDLVIHTGSGELAIVDWKVKRSHEMKYQDKSLTEYRESGQFSHYRWAVGEVIGHPVTLTYTHLIVCEPRFRQILDPCQHDTELDQMWLAGRKRIWAQMEKEVMGEADPWMAENHRDQFGMCEMYGACFECKLDEELMLANYVKEKKQ